VPHHQGHWDPDADHYVFQLHVEGPVAPIWPKGPSPEVRPDYYRGPPDPDGIRTDTWWAPLEYLKEDDPTGSEQTWGQLCDELGLPTEVRDQLGAETPVKSWDKFASEASLPQERGYRTQVTVAHVPPGVRPVGSTAEPVPHTLDAGVEPAGAPQYDFSEESFKEEWKVHTAEIPERAEALLREAREDAEASLPADASPENRHLEELKGIIDRMSDGQIGDHEDLRYRDVAPVYEVREVREEGTRKPKLDEHGRPAWEPSLAARHGGGGGGGHHASTTPDSTVPAAEEGPSTDEGPGVDVEEEEDTST
jgi:hypothetical protein